VKSLADLTVKIELGYTQRTFGHVYCFPDLDAQTQP
jgi:hypothetical protein